MPKMISFYKNYLSSQNHLINLFLKKNPRVANQISTKIKWSNRSKSHKIDNMLNKNNKLKIINYKIEIMIYLKKTIVYGLKYSMKINGYHLIPSTI